MIDYLDILARDAKRTIQNGYYEKIKDVNSLSFSLKDAITHSTRIPIISEIKFASPSSGILRQPNNLEKIAEQMANGGAVGISVLTEPLHFNGSIKYLSAIRKNLDVPLMMKDIVLSTVQIDAARKSGADVILLIQALFNRGHCEKTVHDTIEYCHSLGLETVLEVHTEEEFLSALNTDSDIVGINNRNLETLEVTLDVTKNILVKCPHVGRVVITESGIKYSEDIHQLLRYGVRAFLIGTAIMKARDIETCIMELTTTL